MDALAAGEIAEQCIGVPPLDDHGAHFMSAEMAGMGTEPHHAASRFGRIAEYAGLDPSPDGARKVYGALSGQ
ncbi:MAG: hypothetical protein HQL36_11075 [Alphaproteobacteria bacterium]|nr:hypothetical protein [Alphaproteobacteria bacterium]MBF0251693.1 hypothetical protein [Alphaproteobacteria bacterium]